MKRHYPSNRRAAGLGHIYKRGAVWYVRYLANGKQRAESTRSQNREDAESLLARRLAEIKTGTFAVVPVTAPRRTPLHAIRTARRMTQRDVARVAGVTGSYVSRLERGGYSKAFNWLVRAADGLGTTTDALLDHEAVALTVPDALARADRELLDAMEADAIAFLGPEMLARAGGFRERWRGPSGSGTSRARAIRTCRRSGFLHQTRNAR